MTHSGIDKPVSYGTMERPFLLYVHTESVVAYDSGADSDRLLVITGRKTSATAQCQRRSVSLGERSYRLQTLYFAYAGSAQRLETNRLRFEELSSDTVLLAFADHAVTYPAGPLKDVAGKKNLV